MNNVELNGEFKKKRKGWPIFFMLLAIAFPALNYLYFNWIDPILALGIGVVVFIICIARISRIKKLNKMKLSCCENDLYVSTGKRFYRIPYAKIKRVKKICKKGIKIKATSKHVIEEEAPGVYKDVDSVVRVSDSTGIAKLVAKVKPLSVCKG